MKRLVCLVFAAALGFAAIGACSSDDPATPDATDASTDDVVSMCDSFTKVGDTCSVDPTMVCFRQCTKDGCMCTAGKWVCIKDFSCVPDSGPDFDTGPDEDSATDDDSSTSDAAVDSPIDAPADTHVAQDAGVDAADTSVLPVDAANDSADAANDSSDGS